MALRLSPEVSSERRLLEKDVQVSYFAKKRDGKTSRIAYAELLDISNAGLCMEISPEDSELYMESRGQLFLLNRIIEIQMFCRSHPSNVSVEGRIKWIKRKEEDDVDGQDNGICVGVLFNFDDAHQRRDLAELVSLLKTDVMNCGDCNAPVSTEALLCYNCGARLVRKRAFFRKIINGLLAGNK